VSTEQLAPPVASLGPAGWMRKNLFSTWYDALLTVVLGSVLTLAVFRVAEWSLTEARWGVVTANFRLFLIGTYPVDDAWRIWMSMMILSVFAGVSAAIYGGGAIRTLSAWLAAGQALLGGLALVSGMGPAVAGALLLNATAVGIAFMAGLRRPVSRRTLSLAWLASVPVSVVLLYGIGGPALPIVGTNLWGGLLLTFVLAIVGIVLSFPFGVLLALGRRSDLPVVRTLSTAYIELIRGVPLVTILFMASIMLPLLLPGDIRIDQVIRAMAGITLFSAAYVAENVRGGLQAIPSGQIEAAHALGLSTIQRNLHIILPQALRAVIPANVGLFISLLKDTTLVTIIGLLDVLGIGRAVLAQAQWFGAHMEVYLFIAAIFFVMCYTMSQASYRLEAALGVGKR
jgi:general L-amino acid transport system permease protein